MKNLQLKWFYRLGILLLLLLIIYVFMKISPFWMPILEAITIILFPFVISAFITYLLHPLIEKTSAFGIPRTLSIFIIYVLFFGLVGFSLYKGIPLLLLQLKDFAVHSPELFAVYESFTKNIHHHTETLPSSIHEKIEEMIMGMEERMNVVVAALIGYFKEILNSLFTIVIIPFIVFYMLKDFDTLKKAAWYITPKSWRKPLKYFLRDVDESLGNYLRGQLFVCIIIGLLASFGFWIIGMKYPLVLGTFIGITNIIPYFGPIIGLIPTALIAFTISIKMVLFVSGIIFILQFIEGNILSPLIVGKSLHMHPIMIILALIAGDELGGVVGLILAVPILSILKVIILHIKKHFLLKRTTKI